MYESRSWKELLASFDSYDLVCYCYEKENGLQLRDVIKPLAAGLSADESASVLVVVGPEGGFTTGEVQAAETAGARSVGLGKRILRAETAGMVALTCILYETDEMGGM